MMSINNGQKPFVESIAACDSTNRLMKQYSRSNEVVSGSVFYTDYQTRGRGYADNAWESEKGKNLLFSVFFLPEHVSANRPFVISEMASLCVKFTLDRYIPDVTVKWPNDIYYRDKKISGILIENTMIQDRITQSVIGIGININQTCFRSNAPNPVSLALITEKTYDCAAVLNEFCEIFAKQSKRLNNRRFDEIHNDYLNVIYRKDGFYKYSDTNGVFDAAIRSIEPSGDIVLERTDGSISRYAFKEVMFQEGF